MFHRGAQLTSQAVADVAVVGGGIIGLAIATAVADRGARVVVVDRPLPGAASRAAAGLLAPSLEVPSDQVGALFRAARDGYPAYIETLRERTGIAVALDRSGILDVATSDEEAGALAHRVHADGRWLTPDQVARMEPRLAPTCGAAFWPGDGWVDNIALMAALEAMAHAHPAIARVHATASSLSVDASGAAVEIDGRASIPCGRVVLAAGAWSTLIGGVRLARVVRPVRGQLVRLAGAPLTHAVYTGTCYLVPRGGATVAGTTMEEVGFEAWTTPAARESIAAHARRLCGGLGAELDAWAGLRPATPDLLPLIGPDPAQPALVYACGHSRNGILLAPLTAEIVTAVIFEDSLNLDLSAFRPDRFEDTFSRP